MDSSVASEGFQGFRTRHAQLLARLHAKALAELPILRDYLGLESFAQALARSARQNFREALPSTQQEADYLASLHLADLALACACKEGIQPAWEYFIARFRPILHAAARRLARDPESQELADSLFAELYGLEERAGRRRSLLEYFHGRSQLSTWLRAVLAQRHVDRLRAARRTRPLEELAPASGEGFNPENLPASSSPWAEEGRARDQLARSGDAPDPDRPRYLAMLQAALTQALGALEPRDRLRLSYYYVQDLTLAQIGRLLGEHEATVSRKLERVRQDLRKRVERTLRDAKRLSGAQVRLCFDYALEEWPFDLTGALAQRKGKADP